MKKKINRESFSMKQGHYIHEVTDEEEKEVDTSRYMQTEANPHDGKASIIFGLKSSQYNPDTHVKVRVISAVDF